MESRGRHLGGSVKIPRKGFYMLISMKILNNIKFKSFYYVKANCSPTITLTAIGIGYLIYILFKKVAMRPF